MRKTVDEYIKPKPLMTQNPTKWIMVDKEHPESKNPYNRDEFIRIIISKVIDIIGEKYKSITTEPMSTACSVILYNEKGESDFGHISYNLLFPDYIIEVE